MKARIAGVLPAQRGGCREAGRIFIFQLLSSLVVLFFDAVRHGRRFAPEAPQRSEDSESVMASAIIFPSLQSLFLRPQVIPASTWPVDEIDASQRV